MAGASDKARFYLEQYVPELREDERKQLFSRDEIAAITAKRSDFEHVLNARGSRPSDYVRYATYEMNLASLRRRRARRLGVKTANPFGGARTVFFIMDRATKKFPGDMSLWMQYIQFCQQEKANKKLAKVFASALRLKPREQGLWVLAAKWYAEQQGDMGTARSYMQRGLRFCKDRKQLWLEYAKLEMVYLAKLAARRTILGLDETPKEDVPMEENENVINLPTITASDIDPDANKGMEDINEDALKRFANAPAYSGAIPIAIFESAMKQFDDDPDIADEFSVLVSSFESVQSTPKILQHILNHMRTTAPTSATTRASVARAELNGMEVVSAEFPIALGKALSNLRAGTAEIAEKNKPILAEKALHILLPYLERQGELDEDVETVIVASINQYLRILAPVAHRFTSRPVSALIGATKNGVKLTGEQIRQLWLEAKGRD